MLSLWCAFLFTSAEAKAPEALDIGELYGQNMGWTGNAHTVPEGMVKMHPLNRSAVGVHEQVDVKFGILGQIFGPQAGAEVAIIGGDPDEVTVSLETYNTINWKFDSYSTQNHARVTIPTGGTFVTFSMMGGYGVVTLESTETTQAIVTTGWLARPEIDVTVPLNEMWAFTGTARTAIHGWAADTPNATVGGIFSFATGPFGMSAGLNVIIGGIVGDLPSSFRNADVNIDRNLVVLPLPHVQVWFRF